LKKKKTNITLRELFRKKLEFAEVTPDIALKAKIMQKAAQQEFLRFNPGNFNVFYLGAIIVAGITTGLLLFPGSNKLSPTVQSPGRASTDSNYIEIQVEKPIKERPVLQTVRGESSITTTHIVNSEVKFNQETQAINKPVERTNSVPAVLNKSAKNNFFKQDTAKRKLQKNSVKSETLLVDPQVTFGCAPLKVRFHYNLNSYDSCRWTFGDGGFSLQRDPEWIFDVEGEYRIGLQVYNHNGQVLSYSANVTVYPRPKAHFEISPLKAVLPDNEIRFMNYSSNAVRFRWDFGDGTTSDFFEPNHTYSKFSNYNVRLIVFSEYGCTDSLTVMNAFSGSEFKIDFPNAFIPNPQGPSGGYYSSKSDEAAQVFHPSFSGVSEYQLKIFSKLGIPIFESNDINLGWDGYNKDQLCEPGVYIWKVRGKFRNGEPFIKMGDVTLLKN
jgi:PKD repeat protein